MLDDLRKSTVQEQTDVEEVTYNDVEDQPRRKRFLGMTAVERMFLVMFLFMNVLVIGAALLLVTGRLTL